MAAEGRSGNTGEHRIVPPRVNVSSLGGASEPGTTAKEPLGKLNGLARSPSLSANSETSDSPAGQNPKVSPAPSLHGLASVDYGLYAQGDLRSRMSASDAGDVHRETTVAAAEKLDGDRLDQAVIAATSVMITELARNGLPEEVVDAHVYEMLNPDKSIAEKRQVVRTATEIMADTGIPDPDVLSPADRRLHHTISRRQTDQDL